MQSNVPTFIQTSELEVAYLDSDPAERTCLLVHGWPDDALTWTKVAAQLESRGVRCVRPYLRGFGPTRFTGSNASPSGELVAMALDLIEFVEALDLRDFVLVGHDWGARICYMLATRLADRLKGLVCLSVGYGTNNPGQQLDFEQARLYWYHWYFATDLGRTALAADPSSFTRNLWKHWSPAYALDPSEWMATARSFDNPHWVDITIHSYRHRWGQAAGDPRLEADNAIFGRLPKIVVPTIVLHGEGDGATLPAMSEGKEGFFSRDYARRVLPGVGHFIQREDPTSVAEAVWSVFQRDG